jgi:hypothetical protein
MSALSAAAVFLLASCGPGGQCCTNHLGLSPEEVVKIATQESGLNPDMISPPNADGSRDKGLMQINESNLSKLGLPGETWRDPCASIAAESRLLESFSWYNSGSSAKSLKYAVSVQGVRVSKPPPPPISPSFAGPGKRTRRDASFN